MANYTFWGVQDILDEKRDVKLSIETPASVLRVHATNYVPIDPCVKSESLKNQQNKCV